MKIFKLKKLIYLNKLIDFGISGVSQGNVKESVKAGTLKFIPPEVHFILFF